MPILTYLTTTHFDFGAIKMLAPEMKRLGIKRPLFVTDRGVRAAGLLDRVQAAVPEGARCVALDEQGADLDTRGFAARMDAWRQESRAVALIIGGPDGLDPALKRDCAERLRLSSLTLAHPLVRIVLAEQIYRGWSLLSGHPYHRP